MKDYIRYDEHYKNDDGYDINSDKKLVQQYYLYKKTLSSLSCL